MSVTTPAITYGQVTDHLCIGRRKNTHGNSRRTPKDCKGAHDGCFDLETYLLLALQRLNREIATWRNLRHPNINELIGIAYLDDNLPPGLVSKWIQRNDFMAYIERHPGEKQGMVSTIYATLHFRMGFSTLPRPQTLPTVYNTCMTMVLCMVTSKWYVHVLLTQDTLIVFHPGQYPCLR